MRDYAILSLVLLVTAACGKAPLTEEQKAQVKGVMSSMSNATQSARQLRGRSVKSAAVPGPASPVFGLVAEGRSLMVV